MCIHVRMKALLNTSEHMHGLCWLGAAITHISLLYQLPYFHRRPGLTIEVLDKVYRLATQAEETN